MVNKTSPSMPVVHHRVRTTFASIFGILALTLVLVSLLVVWANRTLTDTSTFVQTVSPLTSQAAVQDFVAAKLAGQLVESAPVGDLANILLTPTEIAGKTPEQLTPLVQTAVEAEVKQVVASPSFATLWHDTNQSAHAQFVSQLASDSPTITLDLNPALAGAVAQLKQTKLATVTDKLELEPGMGTFNLKGGSIDKAHHYYRMFQQGTLVLVGLTVLFIVLSVLISVHHTKTGRRILIGTGVIALILAALLQAPSIVPIKGADPETVAAAKAIAHVLFRNLQLTCLILGVICLAGGIGSKVYDRMSSHR